MQAQGWRAEGEHLVINGFPVQLIAAQGLTEEAVSEATVIEFEGVPGWVFAPEHSIAIAASVGGLKDRARIEQMLQQAEIDRERLDAILLRHHLKLPIS